MAGSVPALRAEQVALARVGRATRSLNVVEARLQDLRRRRTELLTEEAEARRALEDAQRRRRAAS
jgi:hypothetical protein